MLERQREGQREGMAKAKAEGKYEGGVRDIDLAGQVASISNTLPKAQRNTFMSFVERELNNVTGVPIAGDDMQHLIGHFRTEGNRLMTSANATHHDRVSGVQPVTALCPKFLDRGNAARFA